MNTALKEKADLMVDNYHVLKAYFKWEIQFTRHFSAMIHAIRHEKVDVNRLEEIKRYIKDETNWTSYFRGTNIFILTTLLSFEENYEEFFRAVTAAYEKLRDGGFKRGVFLPLCAYTLVKEIPEDQWDYRIKRSSGFYNKMKQNHFWITYQDDYVFAVMLGISDLNVEETSENIERCYQYLSNEGFWKGNDLQALSHILALGQEDLDTKCRKASELYRSLKDVKCRLQYYGLSTLGVLTLITSDVNEVVRDIKEVYDYIYEKDGYGRWRLDKLMRTIIAATLVSDLYVDEIKKGVLQTTLGNSINTIIIAQQQAAIIAACAASSAAASASS